MWRMENQKRRPLEEVERWERVPQPVPLPVLKLWQLERTLQRQLDRTRF